MLTKEKYKKALKIQEKLSAKYSLNIKEQEYFDKLIEKMVEYECYILDKGETK